MVITNSICVNNLSWLTHKFVKIIFYLANINLFKSYYKHQRNHMKCASTCKGCASAFRKNQLEVKLTKKLSFAELAEEDTDDYQRCENEDEMRGK